MIGNDIVDIAAARTESNIRRKGWQEKLFTIGEQEYIKTSANPEIAVWLLWSMKEAAYKAWNRETGERSFNPQKLECTVENLTDEYASGTVSICGSGFLTRTSICDGIIHTIAAIGSERLEQAEEVCPDKLMKDNTRLPYIFRNEIAYPASKSHHGAAVKAIVLT